MKSEFKFIPKSRLTNKVEIDTVKAAKADGLNRNMDTLFKARRYWDSLSTFRKERQRNKDYCYGKQWEDYIEVNGEQMKESEYIAQQGQIPLKNNLIRRLVRNVLGVYRNQSKEPSCYARDRDEQKLGETMSTILQCNWQRNRMSEMNGRAFEEFLISGFVIHKKTYGWKNNSCDCWTDHVDPNRFFIDGNMQDIRHWDASFLGEIHDITFDTLCEYFASSSEDYSKLKEMYNEASRRDFYVDISKQFGDSKLENLDFFIPKDISVCRVIEIWSKEQKPRLHCHDYQNGEYYKIEIEDYKEMVEAVNKQRIQLGTNAGMNKDDIPLIETEWFIDSYWYFRFMTPNGYVLREGETPYNHKSHPYVFKIYPFIDGEIHSFVADVIDQQRYVNRLITMYDWIMRASAKGVLLFPEECLPDDKSLEDIAEEWARFNGVIAIKSKAGVPLPQQVSQNATNIGINELLNLQLKFFEDISGVSGALQGKQGYAGTSAAKYNMETQNATTSLLDLLESFSSFIIDSASKDVKNIQQFYDSKRVFNIAGKNAVAVYDHEKIQDIDLDLSIIESTSSPAYRMMANDFIMQIWQSGQINLEQMLEYGDFPFSDDLLQNLKTQQEQIQQNGQAQGIDPNTMQQAQQGADMNAVNKAQAMLQQPQQQ